MHKPCMPIPVWSFLMPDDQPRFRVRPFLPDTDSTVARVKPLSLPPLAGPFPRVRWTPLTLPLFDHFGGTVRRVRRYPPPPTV